MIPEMLADRSNLGPNSMSDTSLLNLELFEEVFGNYLQVCCCRFWVASTVHTWAAKS